jgi:outer membrane lipoprotein SlyB
MPCKLSSSLSLIVASTALLAACSKPPETPPPAPLAETAAPAPAPAEPSPPAEVAAPLNLPPAAAKPARRHRDRAVANAAQQRSADAPPRAYDSPARVTEPPPPPVCNHCGTVTDIRTIKQPGNASGAGAVAGGIAGLIIGNQIGGGNGRTIAKIAGAAGGAYAGNSIEKRVRAETSYEVVVKLDNGETTTVTQEAAPTVSVGSDVRVVDGKLVAR